MKAVILGGGTGSRLYPVTLVINKHLLPIYNKPMIYYPLSIPMLIGIQDIFIVINPQDLPLFKKILGEGEFFGVKISYVLQEAPLGLAHALMATEEYLKGEKICLVLGDNIFFGHGLPNLLRECRKEIEEQGGAYIFAYHVPDPERYGIVVLDEKGRPIKLEEKPNNSSSNWAVVGLYFYDATIWDKLHRIKPSSRGEYEITSVNQLYLSEKKLKVKLLGRGFSWFDAGTPDSFLEASEFVAVYERRSGRLLACLEEIAYRNGWISEKDLYARAKIFKGSSYGTYLKNLKDNAPLRSFRS